MKPCISFMWRCAAAGVMGLVLVAAALLGWLPAAAQTPDPTTTPTTTPQAGAYTYFLPNVAQGGVWPASTAPSLLPTRPAPTPSPTPIPDATLLAAGDAATCDLSSDEAVAGLIDGIPGTVALLGDAVYPDGTPEQFANCYEPSWGRFKERTLPAVGNHEYHTPGAQGYFDYFGAAAGDPTQGWYSYDLGAWHVVVLNTNCDQVECAAGSLQEVWLRQDLAENARQCTLAYFHHPRFSSGYHGPTLDVDPFWQALYEAGVEIVLNGHEHNYERFAPQDPAGSLDLEHGIRQIIAGTGGIDLKPFPEGDPQPNSLVRIDDAHGALKLTLQDGAYAWEFLPADGGEALDSGTGVCK